VSRQPNRGGDVRLVWRHSYDFQEGGRVDEGALPEAAAAPLPFEIARWSVDPGQRSDPDLHVFRELWMVMSGTGILTVGSQKLTIESGDAVLLESTTPHQVTNTGDRPLRVFSVWWPPHPAT
jgi:mannose-6-phosphate isomerase-like protein (cupin superfamily)